MAAKKATPKKVAKQPPKKASKKIVDRSAEILKRLKVLYPVAICELTHENAFQLLAATILSAQCTDVRVNMVTPALFAEFHSLFNSADCFYKAKCYIAICLKDMERDALRALWPNSWKATQSIDEVLDSAFIHSGTH
jgi:hypothetical protein